MQCSHLIQTELLYQFGICIHSFPCLVAILTIKLATRSLIIQNVMSADTLWVSRAVDYIIFILSENDQTNALVLIIYYTMYSYYHAFGAAKQKYYLSSSVAVSFLNLLSSLPLKRLSRFCESANKLAILIIVGGWGSFSLAMKRYGKSLRVRLCRSSPRWLLLCWNVVSVWHKWNMQKVNIGGKEIKPTWKDDIFNAAVVSDPLYYSKLLVSI